MTEPRAQTPPPPPDLPPSPEEEAAVRPAHGDEPAVAPARPRARDARQSRPRERTCIGCGEHSPPGELVRLVLGPSGEVAVDAAGGGFGHGAHVHARGACLAQAATRGLMRVTKGKARGVSVAVKEGGEVTAGEPAPLSAESLAQAVEAAMTRRIVGLLASAVRARRARIGSDAVTGAWREGEADLVVVATDAAAAADLGAVREAVAAGAAVAWGTRLALAAALQRRPTPEGVAVAAITDAGIAAAVRDAVEKSMGARDAAKSSPRDVRQSVPRDVRQSVPRDGRQAPPGEAKRSKIPVKDAAPRGGFRGKVGPERAGRASGRHLRRAQESRQ